MKFGRDLPWRMIPKWADFYVDYEEWKYLAKTASPNLAVAIVRDLYKVDNFLKLKRQEVERRFSTLTDQYDLTLESWRQETVHCSITDFEKQDIENELTDICADLNALSCYISMTQQAIARTRSKTNDASTELAKLEEVLQAAGSRWKSDLQDINGTLRILCSTESLGLGFSRLLVKCGYDYEQGHSLQRLVSSIREDSITGLQAWFISEPVINHRQLLLTIKAAILASSPKCLRSLIGLLNTLNETVDFSSHNPLCLYIHHASRGTGSKIARDQLAHQGLGLIVNCLDIDRRWTILNTSDSSGRTALHYAARYGFATTCEELIQQFERYCTPGFPKSSSLLVSDNAGETPLSTAINEGHGDVLKMFLQWILPDTSPERFQQYDLGDIGEHLLSLAIRSRCTDITEILLDHEPRLLTSEPRASRLLCLASQYGQQAIVSRLMTYAIDVNYREPIRGKTPLMIAAVHEHTDVVDSLICHPDCDVHIQDYAGWTAVDHAAFRGPPSLIKLIQSHNQVSSTAISRPSHPIQGPSRRSRGQSAASKEISATGNDANHIFVNLGHFDMDKEQSILNLEPFRRLIAPMQIPEASLTLEISGINCDSTTPCVISSPILCDLSNDPLHFTAKDVEMAKLLFRVYSTALPSRNVPPQPSLVGSAVVSLKDARLGLGSSLESLDRDYTVSLISSRQFGYQYAGTITFTFVVSRPFVFEGPLPTPPQLDLRRDVTPWVAGHRGIGQNSPDKNRLQLGENTIDSFNAALRQGADILEVDVQVTRDLVPVIYHDFLLSEIGADVGVHSVTYEQFMVPSNMQISNARPPGTSSSLTTSVESNIQRPRASSVGKLPPDNIDVIARLMSTFNLRNFNFKGNIGSECINGPFITLEQLLVQIDPSVCFDVELKYPMLFEARDFCMDTIAMELNTYLDSILSTVYKHAGSRPLFFTSFSPELCILLSVKQNLYPVLFLTESGYIPTRDIRALSFQEAVRFARKWNLAGVVPRSQNIVAAPGLVGLVKGEGLVCASWGDLNDDVGCVKAQADAKIDVIITNRVGETVRALRS
ncbi:Glycerophosphoryl diester phosphodiesterase family-domain-containing protein [Xylariaceae sp. FL1019]|nr:Glycerophosphoryl diester phosphodiesterase family-domain-containing protein [Xylariaceae sp. FL1019]